MRILTAAGVAGLIVLCVLRRHELGAAAVAVPPQALGALAALHLATLVARSEAWRLSLAALAGAPPPRAAIHAANAGAFVAGALEPHAALPARGGGVPAIAASDSRQASERATSVVRCSTASAPSA